MSALIVSLLIASLQPQAGDDANTPAAAANPCRLRIADAKNPPRFEDFEVGGLPPRRPVAPLLSSKSAKLYRTSIRQDARQGPNFAIHYRIVEIGCGVNCAFAAILDESSGLISFDPALGGVSGVYSGHEPDRTTRPYTYRLDSRLLIVKGAPGENENQDGLYFYEWRKRTFRLIRFIPRSQACTPDD